ATLADQQHIDPLPFIPVDRAGLELALGLEGLRQPFDGPGLEFLAGLVGIRLYPVGGDLIESLVPGQALDAGRQREGSVHAQGDTGRPTGAEAVGQLSLVLAQCFQLRGHQATSFSAAGATSPRAANRVITSEARASTARAAAERGLNQWIGF